MGRAKRWRVDGLAGKLLAIRTTLGMSQNELIQALRLDQTIYQSNISGFESGDREPPLPILLAYARLVGISTDDLIDDKTKLRLKKGK